MRPALAVLALCGAAVAQPRTVAITVDDLPHAGAGHGNAMQINRRLLAAFRRHHAPVTGFVIRATVEELGAQGEAILQAWRRAGAELGNHSYSHHDMNGMTVAQIEEEIVRGETGLGKPRFFRFPMNHTGDTKEKHDAVAAFLAARGYQLATCTIDTSDYLFNTAYARDPSRARRDYLAYTEAEIDYYARLNRQVFGYEPPEVMLLHDNELNAATIDRVLAAFEKRGYRFVTLADAQRDPAYRTPQTYVTKFGPMWGYRWAAERGVKVNGRLEPEPPQWIGQ